MIKIDGVNEYQKEMLDHMWSLGSHEEFMDWFYTLDEEDQHQAYVLRDMVLWAIADQAVAEMQHYNEANKVLVDIARR